MARTEEMATGFKPYQKPEIVIVYLPDDVITLSHFDPNMGEWDTNI